MRIKRILLVLAAFVLTRAMYAQTGQAPAGQQAQDQDQSHPGPRCDIARDDYMEGVTPTQLQIRAQATSRKQLEDQVWQGRSLMTEKAVAKQIESAPAETVIKDVTMRGVDFDMTPSIEQKLRKANANDEVIEAVRQAGPKLRAQMAKLTLGQGLAGVQEAPKEQAQGLSDIMGESHPDKTIALVDDFAKKYPNSLLLSSAYAFGADAYQQKGDVEKVIDYTGKSLKLNSDNLMALILRLGMLPLPQHLRTHAADRDKILQETASDANRALELIQQAAKRSNAADATHQIALIEAASQVHESLGMVHLELAGKTLAGSGPDRAELAKAEQEFTTAVSTTGHPDPRDYFRLGEAYGSDGKVDAAMQAFRKAGALGQGTLIKTYADQQIAQLKKMKGQGSLASNAAVTR